MQSYLPARAYWDQEQFDAELTQLRSLWQFAGFAHQLREHNDFLVREIGGRSVVVQNFQGELHAFQNVCSHRFSRIQTASCGNRALQCPYHGWTYNADGIPAGIPKRPRFDDLTPESCDKLRLERWRVASCGNLVFVTQNLAAAPLAEHLGDAYSTIERLTSALGELVDTNEIHIEANWKILVENTLESYHVNFVHEETFRRLGAGDGQFGWQGLHSSWSTSVSADLIKAMARPLKTLAARPFPVDGYFHQLVFPNVTLATTFGTTFGIQHFEPLTPTSSRFTSYVFATALPAATPLQETILKTLSLSAVDFNRRVFEEDRVVCEFVQQGSRETERQGMLSDEEARVGAFQRAYLQEFARPETPAARAVIVGAGDFARELYGWLNDEWRHQGLNQDIVFVDDNPQALARFPDLQPRLAAAIADYQPLPGDQVFLAVSDPQVKLRLARELADRGALFGTFIHRSAVIEGSAQLGQGCVVCPTAVVSCNAVVGDFVSLNIASTVGHDARIGAGTTLSAHADVTGHAVLGTGVFLGSHASVLPRVKVGDFARIGAGSVAMRNVRAGDTVMGVPAKRLEWPPTIAAAEPRAA